MNKKTQSAEERFWSKVNKTPTCWLWTGATRKNKAQFAIDGTTISASKYAYFLVTGKFQEEPVSLRNDCGNSICVNPAHRASRQDPNRRPVLPPQKKQDWSTATQIARAARIKLYKERGLLSTFTADEIQNLGRIA